MDYPYFTATPQPYQFLGLPPTPAHTSSANSDEFSNNSPPVRPHTHPHQPSSSSSFSYVTYQSPTTPLTTRQQDAFDHFQTSAFDYNQFNGIPQNQTQQQQPNKPQTPIQKPSISANNGFEMGMDLGGDEMRRGSNSDDDDNMTPAQSRRKAQNRAAQRAFRERKERHVKDLEAKLALLEKSSNTLTTENERLKLQLQKASTENEILRATSHRSRSPAHPSTAPLHYSPKDYSPKDFYTDVLVGHEDKRPSHRITRGENGERMLAAGATWDLIVGHELFKKGLVDVGDVSERLKRAARCDGQGPVFEEGVILEAIEKSVASGSDELL